MVGRRLPRPFRLAACLLIVSGSPAWATGDERQAFTAEALVRAEAFGGVRVSPTGRWVAYERQRPLVSASTFDYGSLTGALLSDLVIVDTTGRLPDRTIGADDPAGYQSGPISPDGRKMVIYRLEGRERRLGVITLEDGAVTWFDVSPDMPILGRTVVWRDDDELLAIVTPDRQLPLYYRLGWQAQAVTAERWRDAAAGQTATSTLVLSGPDRDQRPRARPRSLVRLSLATRAVVTLAEGDLFDLEVAPGGDTVAILENAEDLQPDQGEPAAIGAPTRRRRLVLVEIESAQAVRPMPERDLLSHLLTWSPDGHELLVFGRRDSEPWSDGRFLRISASGDGIEPLDLGDARPAIQATPGERIPLVRGAWTGEDPTVLASTPNGDLEWLTAPGQGPARHAALDSRGQFSVASGQVLFWTSDGVRTPAASSPLRNGWRRVAGSTFGDGGSRSRWNPAALKSGAQAVMDDLECLRPAVDRPRALCPQVDRETHILAASADATTVILQGESPDGVGRLLLETSTGHHRRLSEINTGFAEIRWGDVRDIVQSFPDGPPLHHWLLTPVGEPPAKGWPTIVLIYPGKTYGSAPSALQAGSTTTQLNPQILAAAGYAVLMPSLPIDAPPGGDRLGDLADRILQVVDLAAADGVVDGDRLALMGHSFGGYSALRAAAQTERFRAIVASAAVADLGSFLKDTVAATAVPEDGLWVTGAAGSLETGQLGMGVPPWADPARYTAASPLYLAERIRTPVLLVRGDLDPVRAESLFAALYRLDRDAGLLTYWGEGHNLSSPANIVDLHRQVIAWLDRHLGPPNVPDAAQPPLDP